MSIVRSRHASIGWMKSLLPKNASDWLDKVQYVRASLAYCTTFHSIPFLIFTFLFRENDQV